MRKQKLAEKNIEQWCKVVSYSWTQGGSILTHTLPITLTYYY